MPIYLYQHPKTKEIKEIVQRMSEVHEFVLLGVRWQRVFSKPNATIDSFGSLDPFDRRAFVQRTAKTGMKVGDMWDESRKLSEKREAKVGKDFVRANAEDDYKKRTGKDHPEAKKPKLKHININ